MAFLACGTRETRNRCRLAKWNTALVVTKAKTQAWEEFGEATE